MRNLLLLKSPLLAMAMLGMSAPGMASPPIEPPEPPLPDPPVNPLQTQSRIPIRKLAKIHAEKTMALRDWDQLREAHCDPREPKTSPQIATDQHQHSTTGPAKICRECGQKLSGAELREIRSRQARASTNPSRRNAHDRISPWDLAAEDPWIRAKRPHWPGDPEERATR